MEALKNNSSLTSLDLSNNEFGEAGGMYIAAALVCFCSSIKQYNYNFLQAFVKNFVEKLKKISILKKKEIKSDNDL